MPTLDDAGARAAVLRAADRVFYEHGVAGTGMAEIRDSSGISLRRLYGLYPSKRELVAAWLEARHVSWLAWFAEGVERHTSDGLDVVDAIFATLAGWAAMPGYRGCAFLNTAAEECEIDETHRRIIADHKRDLIATIARLLEADSVAEPERTAREVGVLVDGAIVQSAVLGSLDPIEAARMAAHRVCGHAPDPGA
ncbi:MAG: TetR/AcrR family transcriptional regulator [Gaiella sp.]